MRVDSLFGDTVLEVMYEPAKVVKAGKPINGVEMVVIDVPTTEWAQIKKLADEMDLPSNDLTEAWVLIQVRKHKKDMIDLLMLLAEGVWVLDQQLPRHESKPPRIFRSRPDRGAIQALLKLDVAPVKKKEPVQRVTEPQGIRPVRMTTPTIGDESGE